MTTQRVTWKEIDVTIHDINVLLYAVEEALAATGQVPDSMTILKIGLQDLREEVARMRTEKPIEFDAPTPASPLMLGRRPSK